MPFADTTLGLSSQLWLWLRGEAMHNRLSGEYDVVVWDARGKGIPSANLTMFVFATPCSADLSNLSVQPWPGHLL